MFVAVNITVEDTNGDPVPGLNVFIDSGFFNSAVTDADGVAAFGAIRTGPRNVYVATFDPDLRPVRDRRGRRAERPDQRDDRDSEAGLR